MTSTIQRIQKWAAEQPLISGALLVGSHAHGTARPSSDVDIVFLTAYTDSFFKSREWLTTFGKISKIQEEQWGAVRTLRVCYQEGDEIEFNFAAETWASVDPIDPGTLRVVADGAKVLHDPKGVLASLISRVLKNK